MPVKNVPSGNCKTQKALTTSNLVYHRQGGLETRPYGLKSIIRPGSLDFGWRRDGVSL